MKNNLKKIIVSIALVSSLPVNVYDAVQWAGVRFICETTLMERELVNFTYYVDSP